MNRRRARKYASIVIAALVGLALAATPLVLKVNEKIHRAQCAQHLTVIGEILLSYAGDHQGQLPADLGTLAAEEDAATVFFVCPDTDTPHPDTSTADELKSWVNAHSDYIYTGAGLKCEHDPNWGYRLANGDKIVLAYDQEENHHGAGMNVLFGDGNVRWMTVEDARQTIATSEQIRKGMAAARP